MNTRREMYGVVSRIPDEYRRTYNKIVGICPDAGYGGPFPVYLGDQEVGELDYVNTSSPLCPRRHVCAHFNFYNTPTWNKDIYEAGEYVFKWNVVDKKLVSFALVKVE